MRSALHIQLDRLASDRWARRGVRILVRAVWIGLSLCCLGLGASLLFDLPLRWQWLAATGLACVAGGALLVLRPRMSTGAVARRIDRRFRLNEQIATALELDANPTGVESYLLDQSQHTLAQIQRYTGARQALPWTEIGLSLALLVILGGLVLLLGASAPGQLAGAEPLPPLVQPQSRAEQFGDEPFSPPAGQQPGPSQALGPGDPAAIQALADALRDQSLTRQAAEALDQGDLSGAAQRLRELADQAGQISQQARSDLSNNLRQAADQVAPANPNLAEQLRGSADSLQSGSDTQAAQALEDLASAVESLGAGQMAQPEPGQNQGQGGEQQGTGGGAGNGSLPGEQRAQPAARLGVDGVPLELAGQGDGNTPTTGQTDGSIGTSNGGDITQGSASPGTDPVQAADDPLLIPADLRDVVQDYFSP